MSLLHDFADAMTIERNISKARLDFVRRREWQVCIIRFAIAWTRRLRMCEILPHACGPRRANDRHQRWKIATNVKHFNEHS
jgi:hypothetical protein